MNSAQFKAPPGIRQSKVNEIIRTVEKRGITAELRIALERDKHGWKRELVQLLRGKPLDEGIRGTKHKEKSVAFENKTADIDLSSTDQQRITGMLVAGKLDEVCTEARKNNDVREFVAYLRLYSVTDFKVMMNAKKVIEKLDSEQAAPVEKPQAVEPLPPAVVSANTAEKALIVQLLRENRVASVVGNMGMVKEARRYVYFLRSALGDSPELKEAAAQAVGLFEKQMPNEKEIIDELLIGGRLGTVVEKMKASKEIETHVYLMKDSGWHSRLRGMAQGAVELFEKQTDKQIVADEQSDGRLTMSEKVSIASRMRAADVNATYRKLFGTDRVVELGRNAKHDAIIEYIKHLKRNSASETVRNNALEILVKTGVM